ncbi:MAG: hypothetical protein M1840_009080 [Geoglossum simile]|nr:MAG: hypothetical protein M1840_009080 [Geoglossum simile]
MDETFICEGMFQRPGRSEACYAVYLDTGAKVNLIAHSVQKDFGLPLEPSGEILKCLLGPSVEALGTVTVQWWFNHYPGRIYTEKFYVIDSEEFDVLVGKGFIGKNKVLRF